MKVCEIFNGIQGEGLFQGAPATFIRFSGCNLKCPWCDTKYHTHDTKKMDAVEILKQVEHNLVVITGGEPFMQDLEELKHLIELFSSDTIIQFETNGTIPPPEWLPETVWCAVSPKLWAGLVSACVSLWASRTRTFFKFVIDRQFPIDKTLALIDEYDFCASCNPIFFIAEAVTSTEAVEKTKIMSDFLLRYSSTWTNSHFNDIRIQLRQHIMLYDNKRGV